MTMTTPDDTLDDETRDLIRQIEALPPPPEPLYRRLHLRREGDELIFEEDAIAYALEAAVAEIFGDPVPERIVIRIKM